MFEEAGNVAAIMHMIVGRVRPVDGICEIEITPIHCAAVAQQLILDGLLVEQRLHSLQVDVRHINHLP